MLSLVIAMKKSWKTSLAALFSPALLVPDLLPESGGFVALYHEDTKSWTVTDTPLDSLPPHDQALLRQGLPLQTQQDVTKAMEDFCS